MKIDRSEFTKAESGDAADIAHRLVPVGREAQKRIYRQLESLGASLTPMLTELHGIPITLWMRMAQDEYGRTGKVEFAHIMRSLCARSGSKEPRWATEALLEQSNAICEEALSFQLDSRPGRVNAIKRAVRDFRLACQIHKTAKIKKISRIRAFKAVTTLLPANAHGERMSEQTPKRAWQRYASERSYKKLYK